MNLPIDDSTANLSKQSAFFVDILIIPVIPDFKKEDLIIFLEVGSHCASTYAMSTS